MEITQWVKVYDCLREEKFVQRQRRRIEIFQVNNHSGLPHLFFHKLIPPRQLKFYTSVPPMNNSKFRFYEPQNKV